MNRLVIIGNGFDLAHGLKTSYADFLEWYKKDYIDNIKCKWIRQCDDGLCKIDFTGSKSNEVRFDDIPTFDAFCKDYFETNTYKIYSLEKSILLSRIEQEYKNKGWVDIENDYYQLLKEIILGDNYRYNKIEKVKELNNQLELLKKKLIEYLCKIESNAQKCNKLGINSIISSSINIVHDLDSRFSNIKSEESQEIEPENIIILNFNYTNTIKLYFEENEVDILHIHGSLTYPESIIFGYGDEFDDDYKEISNANENEYLLNFKSFKYLENSIYKEVLRFIEYDKFQILLLGHSCGNSDRTLLNTLFNHRNCVSIKPYYHLKENGKDDFSNIIMNISRSFNSISEMRSKVVPKEHCLLLK